MIITGGPHKHCREASTYKLNATHKNSKFKTNNLEFLKIEKKTKIFPADKIGRAHV